MFGSFERKREREIAPNTALSLLCSVGVLLVGSFSVCVHGLLTGVFGSCSVCQIVQCMC